MTHTVLQHPYAFIFIWLLNHEDLEKHTEDICVLQTYTHTCAAIYCGGNGGAE